MCVGVLPWQHDPPPPPCHLPKPPKQVMVYKQYTVIQYPYQNPIMLPFANSSKMSSDVKLDRIQRPGRKIGEDKWLADTFLYQKVCSVLKKKQICG